MLVATNQLEGRNWYGSSILLPSYLPWYWNSWCYAWLMRYTETKINPSIIVTARPGPRRREDRKGDNAIDVGMRAAARCERRDRGPPLLPRPEAPGVNQFKLDTSRTAAGTRPVLRIIDHFQAQK